MKKLTVLLLLLALTLPGCAAPAQSQPQTLVTQPQTQPQTVTQSVDPNAYDFFRYYQAQKYVNLYQQDHPQNAQALFEAYIDQPSLLGEIVDGKYDFAKEKMLFSYNLPLLGLPTKAGGEKKWEPLRQYFAKLERLMAAHPDVEFLLPGEDSIGKEGECLFYVDGGYYLAPSKDRVVLCSYTGTSEVVTIPAEYQDHIAVAIGPRAFEGNQAVKEIVLAEILGYASLSDQAFAGCPSLERVSFQEPYRGSTAANRDFCFYGQGDFDTYEWNAFNQAAKDPAAWQERVYAQKKEQHARAFGSIPVDDKVENYRIVDGVLQKYCGLGGHLVIPEGVTEIASYAFDLCGKNNILSVTLPSTLKRIQSFVFTGCDNLIEITFPAGFEELCEYALYLEGKKYVITEEGQDAYSTCNWIRLNGLPATCTVYEREFEYWPWQIAHVENVK